MDFNRFVWWIKWHKKPILIGLGVLFALLITLWLLGVFRSSTIEREVANTKEEIKPETAASPLTGKQVKPALTERPVTAIVIENSPEARPQSGLKQAGVVFEAIAEGGITRFIAFYQEDRPSLIGPVRSLRPYFNDWILTHDASIAHVGGSAAALNEVQPLGIKDLDQFFNASTYWRSSDRYAPHNVYTNFDNLDSLNNAKGFTSSDLKPWPRKDPSPQANPKAKDISVSVSSGLYDSSYTYQKKNNIYLRSQGGAAHTDREKGQISPSVVIVMEVPNSIIEGGRYAYDLVGSGKVYVFQDGGVIQGSWSRSSRSSEFIYKNQNGERIKLNPGQTWVTAISPGRPVTWTPAPASP